MWQEWNWERDTKVQLCKHLTKWTDRCTEYPSITQSPRAIAGPLRWASFLSLVARHCIKAGPLHLQQASIFFESCVGVPWRTLAKFVLSVATPWPVPHLNFQPNRAIGTWAIGCASGWRKAKIIDLQPLFLYTSTRPKEIRYFSSWGVSPILHPSYTLGVI